MGFSVYGSFYSNHFLSTHFFNSVAFNQGQLRKSSAHHTMVDILRREGDNRYVICMMKIN